MQGMEYYVNFSMSLNTDFSVLESMLDKGNKQQDAEDKALAEIHRECWHRWRPLVSLHYLKLNSQNQELFSEMKSI